MAAEMRDAQGRVRSKDIIAATIGNALEFYDFFIYGLFAIQIGRAFFPAASSYVSLMLSLATFGVGFLTRPLGAIVLGSYADKVGRRPAIVLSLSMTGLSMAALACIPSYAMIGVAAPVLAVTARLIPGFSLGGEVGANSAFLVEAAPPERRAEIVSWQGVSQAIALVLGSFVGTVLTAVLSPAALEHYGWRLAFAVGVAIVPSGYWLRRHLAETLHEQDLSGSVAARGNLGQWELARRHWRVMAFGLMAIAAGAVALFGATTQIGVTWISHVTGSAVAPAWYLIGFTLIGQIAYMLYPETAPVRLRAQATSAVGRGGEVEY